MNIKPLFDRVVILPETKEITSSGLVLPAMSQEKPQCGVVVAVGDGDDTSGEKQPMKVKVGDKVVFSKFAGAEFNWEDKNYIVLRQIDIIGVINEC